MIDNGDSATVLYTTFGKNNWCGTYKAIDGSFHTVANLSYIVVGIVKGEICGNEYNVKEISYKDNICEDCNPEDVMRKMEYDEAQKLDVDLIFLDRKLTFDKFTGKNIISIAKDPANVPNINHETPWLVSSYERDGIRGGYFKLFSFSWVFLVEVTVDWSWQNILSLLYVLGKEPIPEALGYNYILFLVDKVAKYYRDKGSKALNLIAHNYNNYREFRSFIEWKRKKG
ncbi:hypothetical protein SUSAZ_02225 [Sulfolobus acidocaldarius SUSAZ]|nr:hypothetical protein SUSAZ_02225 [Sulfolobus acidocaldarius SUSAZ]